MAEGGARALIVSYINLMVCIRLAVGCTLSSRMLLRLSRLAARSAARCRIMEEEIRLLLISHSE